jgi:hypothetical protein
LEVAAFLTGAFLVIGGFVLIIAGFLGVADA